EIQRIVVTCAGSAKLEISYHVLAEAWSKDKRVGSTATRQSIVSSATIERVVAGTTREHVVCSVSGELIAAAAAAEIADGDIEVASRVARILRRVGKARDDR